MQGKRIERVGHLIQMELGKILLYKSKDPRFQNVTITHVGVTPDMKSARVFYSVLGDEKVKQETKAALERAAGFLQKEIAEVIEMRYTPKFTFSLDDTVDRMLEIDKVLKTIRQEKKPRRKKASS